MEQKRNNVERIKIESISLLNTQIKCENSQLYQKLKACIMKRGQLKNVVVATTNGKYECLDGGKIITAMKELGYDEVLAVNVGEISENEKNLIRLEIFKDYFLCDYSQIGTLIKSIAEERRISDICNSIPFDSRQAEHLVSMTEFDWEEFNQNKQTEGQVNMFDFLDDQAQPNEQEQAINSEENPDGNLEPNDYENPDNPNQTELF